MKDVFQCMLGFLFNSKSIQVRVNVAKSSFLVDVCLPDANRKPNRTRQMHSLINRRMFDRWGASFQTKRTAD